ncbi:hypothetical protein S7711_01576 [Stachybotrys chartarum IBT 7711]|uniref:Uncharacterized protein n=1 Tax=Stachybotrys chartarum (strain CBS 109288 / IBT 7711) TaxID=1280523 RepID=A0A084BC44_STACB|nr:hypothetical protein S7711_01576 [Stachybotrys chartarum IBT 7711]KFA49096.1 hypothetical protein S40293_07097 [Stachybotrys chartarum IBT 40293]
MSTSHPVALILGAGSNTGRHVAAAFLAQGYRVATVSRSLKPEEAEANELRIQSDFSDPGNINQIFTKVEAELGVPEVVVYNAYTMNPQDAQDPLALPVADLVQSLNINTVSAYAAAQKAVLGFQKLPETASRTFIYTGNICNVAPMPFILDLGVGKSASAHFIQCAAEGYKDKGFKFYYADERTADGAPVYHDIDGAAHAKHFLELAKGSRQGPWSQTFAKGIGYKKF